MNPSILRLSAAGLLITLAGLLGVLLLHRRQVELRQMEARVRADLESNQRKRQAMRTARASPPPPAPAAQPAPVAGPAAQPATNLARNYRLAEELGTRPEYAPFHQRRHRRAVLRDYGDLLAELKLTPERAEAFKKILTDRLSGGVDVISLAYRQGYAQGSPEYAKLLKQHFAAVQEAMNGLLNDEEKAAYLRYEATVAWRKNQQLEFDEFVADRGLPPLTPAQKQALSAAFFESRSWKPDPAEGNLTAVEQQRRRSEQMRKLAAAALDPQYQATLAAYLAFNNSRGEIMGRLFYPDRPPGSMVMTVSISRP